MLEDIADAVFLLELDGRIALGNRRAEMITGYPRAELVDRALSSLLPEAGAQEAQARLSAARADPDATPFFEVELIRKDGARVLIEVHVTTVLKDGQPVALLAWPATSRSAATWKISSGRPRRWRASAGSRPAWPTTSTTC